MHTGEDEDHPGVPSLRLARLGTLFLRLARTAHALQRHSVDEIGLTPAQARAMAVLDGCDNPPRMSELAERLHVVPRAVTPIVDALEEAGYVRRGIDPKNRRSTLLELTDEGHRMCQRVTEHRTRAAGELFAPLSEDQRHTLTNLLEQVYANQPEWVTAHGSGRRPSRRA